MSITVDQIYGGKEPLSQKLRHRLLTAARLLLSEASLAGGEVAIVLADDNYLQGLNRRFRGFDRPTDVLTFNLQETADGMMSGDEAPPSAAVGDIYISLDRAREQAAAAGRPFEQEVLILAIHGLLHLCGYDHDSAATAEAMEQREVDILRRVEKNTR
ncbi:MAG TPA: rRNA maturation RNase YbeY [Firmicutes bacterium]|nr:rRNA maturation RNase YbeY [Bacillota bacterium]